MPAAKVYGAEIYYEEAGSGPPIILSPGGLNFSLEPYRAVLEGLSQKHRAIGYDRRFGGRSKSPIVVQTWDLCSNDVIGLMDSLGIEQAYLGGGSFGPGISMSCAARHPHRVRGLILSNMVGGIIPSSYLAGRLFRSGAMAVDQGMKAVIEAAFDPADRCAPFLPDRAKSDPEFRKELEAMDPQEFYQIMNDTIRASLRCPLPNFRDDGGDAQSNYGADADHGPGTTTDTPVRWRSWFIVLFLTPNGRRSCRRVKTRRSTSSESPSLSPRLRPAVPSPALLEYLHVRYPGRSPGACHPVNEERTKPWLYKGISR